MSRDKIKNDYGAEQIQVLEGLEAVRKRPAMYIGSTDAKGLNHLFLEIIDNSIDEYMAGFGDKVIVRLNKDDSITVRDFGRGIPPEKHATGKSTPEVILTVLHAGGKFGGNSGYKSSGGLHGVGSSVVNALSEYLEVKIYRYGKCYRMSFKDGGIVEDSLKVIDKGLDKAITGTEITFKPMDTIFSTTKFNKETIAEKLKESAYLNSGLTLILVDDRNNEEVTEISQSGISEDLIEGYYKIKEYNDKILNSSMDDIIEDSDNEEVENGTDGIEDSNTVKDIDNKEVENEEDRIEGNETNENIDDNEEDYENTDELKESFIDIFLFNNGISDFVKDINKNSSNITDVLHFSGKGSDNIEIDVAFQWGNGYNEKLNSYVNTIKTREGGTHETGYKSAITKAVNDFAKDNSKEFEKYNKKAKKSDKIRTLDGDDIRDGLVGVLSIKVNEDIIQFEGQTKTKLGTNVARKSVENFIYTNLLRYLTENPIISEKIVVKALESYLVKKKSSEISKRSKQGIKSGVNNDKHKKATGKNYKKNELYLVEGSSAGGSAKKGRDNKTQGILELRGKILNVEQVTESEMLNNAEVLTIIDAIGAGYGKTFDVSKAKYGKIIIMTDADDDGKHILMLGLTLFYKYMPEIINNGMLFVARPPLYCYSTMDNRGNITQIEYSWDSEGEEEQILSRFKKNVTPSKQRYKGLGEMNADQLYDTTMCPKNRKLIKVTMGDEEEAYNVIKKFMRSDTVEERKKFINKHMNIETGDNVYI